MIGEVITCDNAGCDVEFVKKTHNQRYHDDECCRIATNAKIMEKYYAKRARKLGLARYCKQCASKLSRYNSEEICNACIKQRSTEKANELTDMLSSVSWQY